MLYAASSIVVVPLYLRVRAYMYAMYCRWCYDTIPTLLERVMFRSFEGHTRPTGWRRALGRPGYSGVEVLYSYSTRRAFQKRLPSCAAFSLQSRRAFSNMRHGHFSVMRILEHTTAVLIVRVLVAVTRTCLYKKRFLDLCGELPNRPKTFVQALASVDYGFCCTSSQIKE